MNEQGNNARKPRSRKAPADSRAVLQFVDGLTRAKCGDNVVDKIERDVRRQRKAKP